MQYGVHISYISLFVLLYRLRLLVTGYGGLIFLWNLILQGEQYLWEGITWTLLPLKPLGTEASQHQARLGLNPIWCIFITFDVDCNCRLWYFPLHHLPCGTRKDGTSRHRGDQQPTAEKQLALALRVEFQFWWKHYSNRCQRSRHSRVANYKK